MNINKRIVKKDRLVTVMKVTDGLQLHVTEPSGREHLAFSNKTRIKRDGMKLTLDATLTMGDVKYHIGDYLRFVWYNHVEVKGPDEYYKNEICGRLDSILFQEDENWVLFTLDPSHCREYGSRAAFGTATHAYDPEYIRSVEKLSYKEYKKIIAP
ncbi:hypothetical protein HY639_02075 [Candidatus Woesearchaeota archaeon]|nr:hypothetical protein [Candidatus Woesearchaeota archaeon]